MKYRSEIDGLRAIAVVPVILFHAGFEIFSGGFIGVDVFFVISGYLITNIIMSEMNEGKFSLLNFYERRARRILPALLFVVLCCIPAAWFLLMPSDMKDFAQSVVAVATFSANILFWRESGYFATAAELKPLLHTWSLAVEEQFYILFPLFLMAAWRFGKRAVLWSLIVSFVVSLAVAHWGAYNYPWPTFYLLPTRAWELIIGSFAAFYLQRNSLSTPQWLNNVLSAFGLSAVLYSVFVFNHATPFPSLYALIPTVGTVLIILFAQQGTWIHALLSVKGVVGVGLISYSLYLWHQPMFVFWRHYSVSGTTLAQMLLLSVLCFPLAVATYRFVETPFRIKIVGSKGIKFGSLALFGTGALGLLLLSPPSLGMQYGSKLTSSFSIQQVNSVECPDFSSVQFHSASCKVYGSGDETIVFWGDSHAGAISEGIGQETLTQIADYRLVVLSHDSCPPLIGVVRDDVVGNASNCPNLEVMQEYLRYIESLDPKSVVLIGRWTLYEHGWHIMGALQSATQFLDTENNREAVSADVSMKNLQNAMLKTFNLLAEFTDVYILSQPPDLQMYHPRQRLSLEYFSPADVQDWHENERDFEDIERASVIDSWRVFCSVNETRCYIWLNGFNLYRDDNHVTPYGAYLLVRHIISELNLNSE